MKRLGSALVMMLAIVSLAHAQSGVSLGVAGTPEVPLAVGSKAGNYSWWGMGGRLDALVGLPSVPWVTPSLETGYSFVPLSLGESDRYAASANLSLVRVGPSVRAALGVGDRLSFFARGHVSGFYAALTGDTTGDATGLSLGAGGGVGFLLSPSVQVELAAGYDTYLELYDAVTIGLSTTVRLAGEGNASIPRADFARGGSGPVEGYVRFASVELDRVFPVLYKYYDDHPMGRATLVNDGRRAIEDVEVRLGLRQFMDAPKLSARVQRLEPGEEREVDVYALFTEEILSVTEGAKVAAELTVDYTVDGRPGADSETITLDTYDRNAMRWDDDRKIAAFVTARDEEVQRFARNNASIVDDRGIDAVRRELQLAMVFLAAMAEHRCAYVVDPSSAYFEMSRDGQAVDSVQFPRQTLQYRAGDCDDLSATYAALLESAGVPTAFITVPGHIYVAFRLDMDASVAARTFARADDLIVRDDGSVWVPVETTLLRDGFLVAWFEGASEWRKHAPDGAATLYPTEEAWRTYEPVAFGVSQFEVDVPPRDDVTVSFAGELDRFVTQEVSSREEAFLDRLRTRPADVRTRNRLGVLYARYGMYDEAEEQFRAAVRSRDYVPALVNLGNIALLRDAIDEARDAYERVLARDEDNEAALLGMARVAYEAEDYDAAEDAHARLSAADPELAERFAYLSGGGSSSGRASDAGRLGSTVVWDESDEDPTRRDAGDGRTEPDGGVFR